VAHFINEGGTLESVTNLTVSDNLGPFSMLTLAAPAVVSNSIFTNNSPMNLVGSGAQVSIAYSLLDPPYSGVLITAGTISGQDPIFLDRQSGNYRVRPSSPVVDSGDSTISTIAPRDLDGRPRILGMNLDMERMSSTPENFFEVLTGSGQDVSASAGPVTLTFPLVIAPGVTTVSVQPGDVDLPEGFSLAGADPPLYFDISTTADHTVPVEVCINYDPGETQNEAVLEIFHLDPTEDGPPFR